MREIHSREEAEKIQFEAVVKQRGENSVEKEAHAMAIAHIHQET
jgi:hypothetical protein